jgi:glutamate carboxypeptidase
MDFFSYFKSHQGKMVSLLKEIVSRESPSADKKAVDLCSSFVTDELRKTGAKVLRFPQKEIGNLTLAQYPPKPKKEKEQILLLTHLDTVWPMGKIRQMPFYVSENKIFGPGVLDMKASLVMVIFSFRALSELNLKPRKRISVFINSAEEIGHEASHDVIRNLARNSTSVLCLEPSLPGGALKIQRKGRLVIRLSAKGKAAHAGTPEKGINAIDEITLQLSRLKKIETNQMTMNIGLIGGGERANVVAENAWAVLDMRFWYTFQKEQILRFLRKTKPVLDGARIKFSVESLTPPMEHTKASAGLLVQVRKIASSLNLRLETGKTGGGSDASIASSLGIPTLDGLGPDGDGIHAENEHLLLPSLVERTALLTELLIRL